MSEAKAKRKYTILPGVPTPDYETIIKATSDYTDPGELDYNEERVYAHESVEEKIAAPAQPVDNADVAELKKLGAEVSAQEEKARIESQNRMNDIKNRAVTAVASIADLKEVAAKNLGDDEERRGQIEAEMKLREEEAKKQEELERVRAERRAQQKKAVEELKAKSAANEAAAEAAKAEEAKKAAENDDDMNLILSDEETADSFSEFL